LNSAKPKKSSILIIPSKKKKAANSKLINSMKLHHVKQKWNWSTQWKNISKQQQTIDQLFEDCNNKWIINFYCTQQDKKKSIKRKLIRLMKNIIRKATNNWLMNWRFQQQKRQFFIHQAHQEITKQIIKKLNTKPHRKSNKQLISELNFSTPNESLVFSHPKQHKEKIY
jgi:hypothetical protein